MPRPAVVPVSRAAAVRATGWAIALGVAGCSPPGAAAVADVERQVLTPLANGDAHWREAGYTELTPTLLPPGDAADQLDVEIWVWLPTNGQIDIAGEPDAELAFPVGTIVDRVERVDGAVADVRGTELTEAGPRFHVYRQDRNGRLLGAAWAQGDRAAFEAVRGALESLSESGGLFARGERGHTAAARATSLTRFLGTLGCEGCHRAFVSDASPVEARTVRRGTDASGLFVPRAVFVEEAPLETYRPSLENDPRFASMVCAAGAVDHAESTDARCSDGTFPRWHFALAAAMRAGDRHARRVCASRRWMIERMTAGARARFGSALAPCEAEPP